MKDADHSLAFMDFVKKYSPNDEWTLSHEQYRPFILFHRTQAAALAALADEEHLARVVALAKAERTRVESFLRNMGLDVAPSRGNFLFFNCRQNASAFAEGLLREGVIVKPWKQQDFDSYVRVSIGSPAENDHFMAALSPLLL